MIRRKPERKLGFSYQVSSDEIHRDPGELLAAFCGRHGLSIERSEGDRWDLLLHGNTRVFGFISREIDEEISVHLARWAEGREIVVSCEPHETHSAHAAGAAGILVFAASAWIFGGFKDGALAALAISVAGWLVVEVTRHWGLDALEGRIRGLTSDLGKVIWPELSGQLIEPDHPR